MKENRLRITCEELPDIFVTDTTKDEIKKMGLDRYNKAVLKYDKHYIYHLNNYCFRAMRGNETLGFLVLAPKHEKSKENEILYLSLIHVLKPHRRQGIGQFLFMTANALSQLMGYKTIFFESDKELPDSVPFCEAMIRHVKEDYNGNVTRL